MKSRTKLPIFSSQVISIAVRQHSVDSLSCQTILVASLSYSLGISTCKTERYEDKSKKWNVISSMFKAAMTVPWDGTDST